jgi:hypothetical protein
MLRRECVHTIDGEQKLEVDSLFSPERAVIVEGRDPLFRSDEIRRTFPCYSLDEIYNRFLGRSVVP